MALTTLDPKTALLVIDLRNGIVTVPTVHPVDAMTDKSPEAHANTVTRIFPRLGETGTTLEILDLLASTRS